MVTFEGVLPRDVLQPLVWPFGQHLRCEALTMYLLVEAQDGYQVVFTLPELDALFTDKIVLVADRRVGKPLSEKEGPSESLFQTISGKPAGFDRSIQSPSDTQRNQIDVHSL